VLRVWRVEKKTHERRWNGVLDFWVEGGLKKLCSGRVMEWSVLLWPAVCLFRF
jgi:hypothetical protein